MNSLHRESAGAARGTRLMALWLVPAGLAATAALAATALLGGMSSPGDNVGGSTVTGEAGGADTSSQSSEPRLRVVGASYTLQRSADGLVKLQITDPAGRLDRAGLQKDLDKAGVPSRVLAGDPACQPKPKPAATPSPSTGAGSPRASESARSHVADDRLFKGRAFDIAMENGKSILVVRPAEIPAGQEIMVGFPHAATDPANALSVISGALIATDAPYCVPAPAK